MAFVIGVTLLVKDKEIWHLYTYMSHMLLGVELNWTVYDKVLFAIMKVFEGWRMWLLLAQHEIEV